MGGENAFSRTDRRLIERMIEAMQRQADATEQLAAEVERLNEQRNTDGD